MTGSGMTGPGMPPARPSTEQAHLRGLDLCAGALAAATVVAVAVAAPIGGQHVVAGLGAGGVLALAMLALTRACLSRAGAASVERVGPLAVLPFVGNLALAGLVAVLVNGNGTVDHTAFGLALLVGVVVSVLAQAVATLPGRTTAVTPVDTVGPSAYDDDAAARDADRARVAARTGRRAG